MMIRGAATNLRGQHRRRAITAAMIAPPLLVCNHHTLRRKRKEPNSRHERRQSPSSTLQRPSSSLMHRFYYSSTPLLEQQGSQHQQAQRPNNQNAAFRSVYDDSDNWRDWFTTAEYEDSWDKQSSTLRPIGLYAPADYATRHVLSLLQNFHHFENVTTTQCNNTLTKLLDLMPLTSKASTSSNDDNDNNNRESYQAIAQRAVAILDRMEFLDRTLSSDTATDHHHHTDHLLIAGDRRTRVGGATRNKLARPIPKPSRDTYNIVLQILSRTPSSTTTTATDDTTTPEPAFGHNIPQQAQEIVERMEKRYKDRHELDMRITRFHCNCVLLAWKECDAVDAPVRAMRILMDVAARRDTPELLIDSSTYLHMLRICAHYHQQRKHPADGSSSDDDKLLKQRQLLGTSVAIKLWQELFECDETQKETQVLPNTVEFSSHFYSHFLQAIRPLGSTSGSTPLDVALRERYFDMCFARACEQGKVNAFVLKEFFLHCQSPKLFDKHLGAFRQKVYGMSANDAVQAILKIMPTSWSCHADEGSAHDHLVHNQPPPPLQSSQVTESLANKK